MRGRAEPEWLSFFFFFFFFFFFSLSLSLCVFTIYSPIYADAIRRHAHIFSKVVGKETDSWTTFVRPMY